MLEQTRYNTVLLPPDNFADLYIDFSQDNFSGIQDGYCLKQGRALPHITLCQARINTQDQLDDLMGSLENVDKAFSAAIEFGSYYASKKPDKAIVYTGLAVRVPNDPLQALHNLVYKKHRNLQLEVLNPSGEEYWPHLTFARFKDSAVIPELSFPERFWLTIPDWRVAFGVSDEAGQFLSEIELC